MRWVYGVVMLGTASCFMPPRVQLQRITRGQPRSRRPGAGAAAAETWLKATSTDDPDINKLRREIDELDSQLNEMSTPSNASVAVLDKKQQDDVWSRYKLFMAQDGLWNDIFFFYTEITDNALNNGRPEDFLGFEESVGQVQAKREAKSREVKVTHPTSDF